MQDVQAEFGGTREVPRVQKHERMSALVIQYSFSLRHAWICASRLQFKNRDRGSSERFNPRSRFPASKDAMFK